MFEMFQPLYIILFINKDSKNIYELSNIRVIIPFLICDSFPDPINIFIILTNYVYFFLMDILEYYINHKRY